MADWISPDGTMRKEIIIQGGKWDNKPSEGSQCTITITNSPLLKEYTNAVVTIGDNDGELWRALDICLSTMSIGEKSKFTIDLNSNYISLVVELIDLVFKGFIFEWSASEKYRLAMHHKEKGNDFFKSKNNKEAAYRYSKALKILYAIPIDIEGNPSCVDGILTSDINRLKCNLYNNLSACYFKNERWDRVIDLCNKVLTFDDNNVKALYKIGVAYENERNFEKAHEIFSKVMEMDRGNKACIEHLSAVKEEMKIAEIKMKNITKRMFAACLESSK